MIRKKNTESIVKDIKRKTRRMFSTERRIRIVLEGLMGEESASGSCRREGIAQGLYHRWSEDFLEAGNKRLSLSELRQAEPVRNGNMFTSV